MSEQDLNEILRLRREKLTKLREAGVNPYPYSYEKSVHIPDLLDSFDAKLEGEEGTGDEFSIAGRIVSVRVMGKAAFCHVRDEFGQIQVYVQRDRIGTEAYQIFKMLDISDIVGFRGTAFRTKTGEPSLRASSFELLSKSLRPLPVVKEVEGEKHHAFTDKEARYRQRYIDLAVNPEVRNIFRTRAKIISAFREFLDGEGFLEVETPTLQPLYGGALARPFTTFYNVLEREFYLRIADELYLKRLIAGGFERVYEICKDFRNEGMDKFHNPEFTMLEFYAAYADFEGIMNLSEEMFRHVARKALGTTEVTWQGTTVDFGRPFRRARFFDLLQDAVGKDLLGMEIRELGEFAKAQGIEVTKQMGEGKILDELMKEKVRPHLIEPTFIYDYPLSLSPLAKVHRKDARLVERFQPFALGFELGNAFSELNDPLDQRARFEAQRQLKEAGDEETQPIDEDFLHALEYGMPPTGGMGIGVDRLTMLLTNQESISEVILFPARSTPRLTSSDLEKSARRIIEQLGKFMYSSGHTHTAPPTGKHINEYDIDLNTHIGNLHFEIKATTQLSFNDFKRLSDEVDLFDTPRVPIMLIEKKDYDPESRGVDLVDASDCGVSLLDLDDLRRLVKWLNLGTYWIKSADGLKFHRPWCHWAHMIRIPELVTEPAVPVECRMRCCKTH